MSKLTALQTRGEAAQDEAGEPEYKALTAEEVRQLRERYPSGSPWRVVAAQFLVGGLAAVLALVVTGRPAVAWSVAYGAMAVAVPAAVFARGLTGRLSSVSPQAAVLGFFFWEMVKLGLTVALLLAAPRLMTAPSWPAMLVGLVVTIKVYWVALAFGKKSVRSPRS